MIYDGKYEIYDGKIRLDMLISNGVLLIFSSGSRDLVWSRWQRRIFLKMADSSGFSWWRHINTPAASNQATMSKDYFKTWWNGTKDTKPAQPATENEFIAIISLAEASPSTSPISFLWPWRLTKDNDCWAFLVKDLSVCGVCVCVCVCVRPHIISFLHTHRRPSQKTSPAQVRGHRDDVFLLTTKLRCNQGLCRERHDGEHLSLSVF